MKAYLHIAKHELSRVRNLSDIQAYLSPYVERIDLHHLQNVELQEL